MCQSHLSQLQSSLHLSGTVLGYGMHQLQPAFQSSRLCMQELWYLMSCQIIPKKKTSKCRLTLTHPAEDSCGLENHIISNNGILLDLSVDPSDQTSAIFRHTEALRTHKHWSNGGKLIKGLGIEELTSGLLGNLKKSTGDIISDRVPKDAGCGFFGGNIADLAGRDKD